MRRGKFKRRKRNSGPRHKFNLYVRSGDGKVLHDEKGKAVVSEVRWRGHGYVKHEGRLLPTKWATADTRENLDKEIDKMESDARALLLKGDAIWDDASESLVEAPKPRHDAHFGDCTINNAFEKYLASSDCRADGTRYRSVWRTHISVRVHREQESPLGYKQLSELSKSDLQELDGWLATDRLAEELYTEDGEEKTRWIQRAKLSPKSFAEVRNVLRVVTNYVKTNSEEFPGVKIAFHPGDYKPKRAWSQKRVKSELIADNDKFGELVSAAETFYAETADNGWLSMIAIMALVRHTLRPAEAQAVTWGQFRKVGASVYLDVTHQVKAMKGGEQRVHVLKTDASADSIVIASSIYSLIEKTKNIGSIYVAPSANGANGVNRWMSKGSIEKRWRILQSKVGFDGDLYSLKHGLIRDLLKAGRTADEIIFLTRHTTPTMIRDVYGSMAKGDLAAAIDKM